MRRLVNLAAGFGARRLLTFLTGSVGAAILFILLHGAPTPSRAAQCQDGFVIWSHSQTGAIAVRESGSDNLLNGNVHSNSEITISGSRNTITGTPEYVTTFRDSGGENVYPAPVQVLADNVPPVSFNIAEYRPGGTSAIAAGSNYHSVTGDLVVTATEAALGGLWYATGNISVSDDSLTSTITLVADGTIQVSASGLNFTQFIDGLLLFANEIDDTAASVLKVSGSGSLHAGIMFALGGKIEFAGSTNTFNGMGVGQRVKLTGSDHTFNFAAGLCVPPTPIPTATTTPTLTATSTPTPTPTFTNTPTPTITNTPTVTPTPTPVPLETVAGGGDGTCDGNETNELGDNCPATDSILDPHGIYETGTENSLYVADTVHCRVRKVSGGIITTVAGDGTCAFGGDGGLATDAQLNHPYDVFVHVSDLYIADTDNCRVRKVNLTTNIIDTAAGTGTCGFNGDNISATGAQLNRPRGVFVDDSGDLYIADTDNCRVRKVSGGIITTVAGNGICGFGGSGGTATGGGDLGFGGEDVPATDTRLNRPFDVYFLLPEEDLLIADRDNHRIRRVEPATGLISTFAGNGTAGSFGDNGAAIFASLNAPEQLAAEDYRVFIADTGNDRIRRVNALTGIITTFIGDGGLTIPIALSGPGGVAIGSITFSNTGDGTVGTAGIDPDTGDPTGRFGSSTACSIRPGAATIDWALPVLLLGLILGRKRIGALFIRLLSAVGLARPPAGSTATPAR